MKEDRISVGGKCIVISWTCMVQREGGLSWLTWLLGKFADIFTEAADTDFALWIWGPDKVIKFLDLISFESG